MTTAYDLKVKQELATYRGKIRVNDLPASYVYCSDRHWHPRLVALGFPNLDEFYLHYLLAAPGRADAPRRWLSVGAGNCDLEVHLGECLRARGEEHWICECLDLNPAMLERGRALAAAAGLEDRFRFIAADIRDWEAPAGAYDAILASQSLHHFTELEILFDKILAALAPDGRFLTNDMIGRNGHQRWPEVIQILRPLWSVLDEAHRFNHHTGLVEPEFINWDYSCAGFEGIRAQDILALLLERFSFEVFLGFGNLIDPFIERGFGHNFDPSSAVDRQFLDLVMALDDHYLETGQFKPTHMIAALRRPTSGLEPRCHKHLTPGFCLRARPAAPAPPPSSGLQSIP